MTLEEKAEKYVFSNPPSVVIDNHSYFLPSDLKQAYLAGAEELEQENRLLGERCTQLLKDKGDLTDELQELKETFAQTIENDEVAYETLKLHDQEEIGMLNSKITKLENKIADIKANCDLAIEGRDVKIMELEQKLEQTEKDLADYQFNYPTIKELEEENNKLLDVINNQDVKIADLEKQIEKMKCCGNCKSEDNDYMEKPCCECSRCLGDIKRNGTSDKWEIKENG